MGFNFSSNYDILKNFPHNRYSPVELYNFVFVNYFLRDLNLDFSNPIFGNFGFLFSKL